MNKLIKRIAQMYLAFRSWLDQYLNVDLMEEVFIGFSLGLATLFGVGYSLYHAMRTESLWPLLWLIPSIFVGSVTFAYLEKRV